MACPNKSVFHTASQDGGVGKHGLPTPTTTAKITTKLQNNYHPQSSENQAVWKSNNKGIKEVTFIQTRTRDADTEQTVPHLCAVDKNWKEYLSPTADHPNQGSSARKISPHNF